MADAWGGAWGSAWGASWGTPGGTTPHKLPRGGSGGRKHRPGEITRQQVEHWWDRHDALVQRTARLRQREQRAAVQASVEAVSRSLEAAEEHSEPSEAVQRQFDAMIAAVDRAIGARTAAKVVAAAKQAEQEAILILQSIEDENTAILLLLA